MAQQRARMEARRKRLAEQKKKEQAKAKAKKPEKKATPAKSRPLLPSKAPKTGADAFKVLGITKPSKPTKKAPVPAGKVPAPAKPTKPAKPPVQSTPTKPKASNKAVEGGYTISAKNRQPKPKVKKAKDGMPYQGVFPGTPVKEEKRKSAKPRRGGGVRKAKTGPITKQSGNTPAKTTKTIRIGNKTVTMVWKNGKWTPKK